VDAAGFRKICGDLGIEAAPGSYSVVGASEGIAAHKQIGREQHARLGQALHQHPV